MGRGDANDRPEKELQHIGRVGVRDVERAASLVLSCEPRLIGPHWETWEQVGELERERAADEASRDRLARHKCFGREPSLRPDCRWHTLRFGKSGKWFGLGGAECERPFAVHGFSCADGGLGDVGMEADPDGDRHQPNGWVRYCVINIPEWWTSAELLCRCTRCSLARSCNSRKL